jgi:hypothetical protein
VDALLAGRPLPDGLRPYLAWLPRFRSRSRAAAGRLIELERAGRLGRPVAEIAASLVHMSANRWLHTGDSDTELLLYGVASKAYGSLLARGVHEADGALAGAQPSGR